MTYSNVRDQDTVGDTTVTLHDDYSVFIERGESTDSYKYHTVSLTTQEARVVFDMFLDDLSSTDAVGDSPNDEDANLQEDEE